MIFAFNFYFYILHITAKTYINFYVLKRHPFIYEKTLLMNVIANIILIISTLYYQFGKNDVLLIFCSIYIEFKHTFFHGEYFYA